MHAWLSLIAALTLIATVSALVTLTGSAAAKGGGQLESWGTKGTVAGQFFNPGMLGVDPSDGTVYSGDLSADKQSYRIQQFSPSGELKASATTPRLVSGALRTLHGIAVDPGLERLYVVQGCRVASGLLNCKTTGSLFAGLQILVFSTKAEGFALVPDKTIATIALPSGEKELYFPQDIAVDPSTHEVEVLAENAAHQTVLQRFSSAGVEGARFTDTEGKLRFSGATKPASGRDSSSIAISSAGATYALTGDPNATGATRAWQLPASLAKVEAVPGFAEAAAGWTAPMSGSAEDFIGGSQLAISADGSTLYWKELVTRSESNEAGSMLVRGYSLAGKTTTSLWGNGTSSCKITTTNAGIAAAPSGKVVAFDYGPVSDTPSYGVKVLTFGPAGGGCPEPKAKFTVNGKAEGEEPSGIKPGDTVSFNAAGSELFTGFRRELIWKFGDGSEKVVKFTPGGEGEPDKEAATTVTHAYSSAAKVTVRLEIKLSAAVLGNPDPVERSFTVGTPASLFKLTVSKSGGGTGTVSSTPSGISCGATCEAEYNGGEEVELTPTPAAGSKFVKWTGACTGSGSCKVTMSAAKAVGAEFALIPNFKLKVTRAGSGSGNVSSFPVGIECGSTCEAGFEEGKVVTLTASPDPGSQFSGWSGACAGGGSCEVTMSAAREVTATFVPEQHLLTVSKSGGGTGTVSSAPAGINCGPTCSASFAHGVEVTLTPAAEPGSEFKGWSGACSGSGTCIVTMSAAKAVTAEFAPIPLFKLTVSKSGSGTGSVTSSPAGINCAPTCEAEFESGKEVTLTPSPNAGSEFKGWSGACSGSGSCKVTMTAAKSVGAEFALIPGQVLLTVTKAGNGTGTVTSTPAGVDCGSTCEAGFTEGTSVVLKAVAGPNTKAVVWSGCGEIVGSNECKVAMSGAKQVTATFTLERFQLTVTKPGSGTGTVSSTPSGISCGATCEAGFEDGKVVTLTASPDPGSQFSGWSGACAGGGSCKVTMSAAKAVGAEFALIPNFDLKVVKAGTGSGTVTSAPAGISCGSTCEAGFEDGKVVTLTASPDPGSQFSGWSGACAGGGSCEVTMSVAREVTATFTLEQHSLTVTKTGSGAGAVTSSPAGIDCGPTCSASFGHGVEVTLTPSPNAGSEFKGWTGACTGSGSCKVTIDGAREVTASFALVPPATPTEAPPSGPPPASPPQGRGVAPGPGKLAPPVTLAGPSSDVVDFGGVAMASDGSGGAVYVKTVEGTPHVFANRYVGGGWSGPIRVDNLPYEAADARIAAGPRGELLAVWVSQVATVKKKVRYGLYSARIGRGAAEFGPPQVVDANVCEGVGVGPSLAATAPSQAIVAYRVVTYTFDGNEYCGNVFPGAVQLRPGDVRAEIRVARLKEDRWARLGAMNNNPEASMRAPSASNGPQVGAGVDGGAVVAWQETDQGGTARILMRRIFGTVPGEVLQASPTTLEGSPVSGDVDAFSLAVTPLDQARVAMRIQPSSAGGRPRLALNTLPPGYQVPSNALVGPATVFVAESTAANAIGRPGISAYEKGGQEGQLRLSAIAGSQVRQFGVDAKGALEPIATPSTPPAVPGAESVTVLDPAGAGSVAYPALAAGTQAVAVRQEFANGVTQSGLVSGLQGGPVAELRADGSGSGDGLIGFRQGEAGNYQVVVERLTAKPASFKVRGPRKWTRPSQVMLRWEASRSNAGRVTYSVLLGGNVVKRGLRQRKFRLRPASLGTGRRQARVLATDGIGQQLLSKKVRLLIDGEAPLVSVEPRGGRVTVDLRDPDSGVAKKATEVSFGDGAHAAGGSRLRHDYARPGHYTIVVQAQDRVGNRIVRSFEVKVP
ncbi:MAG: InlB B-repeat-containing protein [Solirubrobacterales bacterium]